MPYVEFIDSDRLDHVALPGEQGVDVLQRLIDSCAQPPDRLVVAGVAVQSGLSRPDKGGVLLLQRPHVFVQRAQMFVSLRQPLRVLRGQTPSEYTPEALHPGLLVGALLAAGEL